MRRLPDVLTDAPWSSWCRLTSGNISRGRSCQDLMLCAVNVDALGGVAVAGGVVAAAIYDAGDRFDA
jgi:hypothetical protein